MLNRLAINSVGRDFVVGDIHGCFDQLELALTHVAFDRANDRLIAVGDLVDRGPASERVEEFLAQSWFYSVRGNHEQMLIDQEPYDRYTIENEGSTWFYRLDHARQQALRERFAGLPLAIQVETSHGAVGIVHADVPHNDWLRLSTADYDPTLSATLLWSRTRYSSGKGDRVNNIDFVVVGHTPQEIIPAVIANVINIDGGFYAEPDKLRIFEVKDLCRVARLKLIRFSC